MAWTAPKTWSSGETLTAANFNTHIRDNLLVAGPHLIARKTADQSQGTGSFVDDSHLVLAMGANDVWQVELTLAVSSAASIALAWKFPSGNIFLTAAGINATPASVFFTWDASSSPSSNTSWSSGQNLRVYGLVRNGATPGNFLPYWEGLSGTGTFMANSTLYGVKLA